MLFTKGQASFDWKEIMSAVREDIGGFFEGGGWDFLDVDNDLTDPNAPKEKKKKKKRGGDDDEDEDADEDGEDGPSSIMQVCIALIGVLIFKEQM